MKSGEYAKMYEAERNFWWFVGKGELAAALFRKWFPEDGDFLDAGCGTGANLERMSGRGLWVGLDAESEALGFCSRRGLGGLVAGSAERLPFAASSFDGAMALDLAEHLDDDGAAFEELARALRPGGRLLVTVPAYRWLWSAHDEALGHRRRYRPAELVRVAREHGFEVLWMSHFMSLLFPLMAPAKVLQRFFGSREATISYDWPRRINGILLRAARLENRILERRSFGLGVSLAAVFEKRG